MNRPRLAAGIGVCIAALVVAAWCRGKVSSRSSNSQPVESIAAKDPVNPGLNSWKLPSRPNSVLSNRNLAAFLDPANPHRIPDDIRIVLPTVAGADELSAVASVVADEQEPAVIRHEALQLLRRSRYAQFVQLLEAIIRDSASERVRGYAVQYLGHEALSPSLPNRDASLALIRACLDDRQLEVRREALLALGRAKDESVGSMLADPWQADCDGRRDVVCQLWSELRLKQNAEHLPRLLSDTDDMTAIAALALVSEWHCVELAEAVEKLKNRNQRVSRIAASTLATLGLH